MLFSPNTNPWENPWHHSDAPRFRCWKTKFFGRFLYSVRFLNRSVFSSAWSFEIYINYILKTFDRGYFLQQLILSLENPMNFCTKRRRDWPELLTNFSKILKLKNMKLFSETILCHTRVWAGLTDFEYYFDSNKNWTRKLDLRQKNFSSSVGLAFQVQTIGAF